MIPGIDISVDQGDVDFGQVKASGLVAWVHAKATEGITYTDALYAQNHDRAKIAGEPFGGYHFFRGGDNGAAQAQHFLQTIDGREGDVLPMVDCEEGGRDGVDASTYLGRLAMFLKTLDATLRGKRTIIYFEYSFWVDFLGGYDGFSGHPAFPAAYNNDSSLDMTGTGWADWTIWQYSDGSGLPLIPGISTNVDRDRLRGELSTILR